MQLRHEIRNKTASFRDGPRVNIRSLNAFSSACAQERLLDCRQVFFALRFETPGHSDYNGNAEIQCLQNFQFHIELKRSHTIL
ncbi:hypothetical protein CDAR_394451 [Caerostris darwini]|uniref:Uncharacterized protein n=1 Tax=Caerostris darwini TaxID=1538125 RepID=A0AAV4MC43_9ARAC|nr:hypothetical protein CDAR_394451 [Caerostris darwini]